MGFASLNPSYMPPMQPTHDPSLTSYYITDAFYRELVENFSDWQRDELAIGDPAERDVFRALLEREARLLDQLRFDEWLALYVPECLYWVPATPEAGRPHLSAAYRLCLVAGAEVAHRAHDRQRRGVRDRPRKRPHGPLESP